MKARSALFLSLFAATAFAGQSSETVDLRLKLEPGQKLSYLSQTNVAQEMMGTDLSMSMGMTLNLSVDKSDKGPKVITEITGAKATLPENAPVPFTVEDMQKAMESVKTTAVYSERGKSSETTFEGNEMAKMLQSSMSNMQTGFLGIEYPEKPVAVGESWTVEFELPRPNGQGPKKTMPVTYKLTKVENGIATVTSAVKGKIETEGMGGMMMTVDTDTVNEYTIDIATGLPKSIKTTGKNQIDLGIGVMDQRIDSSVTRQ